MSEFWEGCPYRDDGVCILTLSQVVKCPSPECHCQGRQGILHESDVDLQVAKTCESIGNLAVSISRMGNLASNAKDAIMNLTNVFNRLGDGNEG